MDFASMPNELWWTLALLFGALWGSFFNVAIYRWPRDMSVVSPPSHCPDCGAPVPAALNLPIVGYVLVKGRTRCCGAQLSARYPVVEALSAVVCLALVHKFVVQRPADIDLQQAWLQASVYFVFAGGLIIATFVDLEHMLIPDEVSLPGTALGLLTADARSDVDVADAAVGAGSGFLIIQLGFVWAYERLLGRRGMGEGDSKLLMMIGAFEGWQGTVFSLFAGATQGAVLALVFLLFGQRFKQKQDDDMPAAEQADHKSAQPLGRLKLPFGPFLALAALEYLFFGPQLLRAYLDLL